MVWNGGVAWLPWALLLLWVPGCSSLRGPDSVSGTVGGSLSVRCQYKEVFRDHDKYWCKSPCVWKKIVETTESQREVTKGRVSIRDHPADLTFTVTLKSLTEGDAGTYKCGIDTLWWVDPTFSVVVSVNPATMSTSSASITVTQISTITAEMKTKLYWSSSSPAPTTTGATHSASSQEELQPSQSLGGTTKSLPARHGPVSPSRLQVLLSLLALLLLLLGGSSLLAWRMIRRHRRVKAGENSEPLRTPGQATQQGELCYANLELPMWPLRAEPVQPRQVEVEYSTVQKASREEPYYSSVVFDFQSEDSKANRIRSQRTLEQETQYSMIKNT
ncbi:CMRF35-like molecule 8 isoform X1 [Canis lupus familiaris]|uniref:CMRF35-like molecule 8 isoform X1 n=1 Tax=Canis lupus familiaris TaxID=9615 RepID=UPI0018F7D29D|nr:CMRF35-like molecule 8 isoform X1 [Canis lupus familiaris]XP_038531732.1 CMRF35-like molecule 8 isoform X1 [Canis lupus familiaris]XP_038531733.1 CMRF35-like molecule 8 isoform X1 [Canis lupus familiaris]XP_038531734.1 CMRF35-like molecule 8 isoform X1 [Canis lupus familiaris]